MDATRLAQMLDTLGSEPRLRIIASLETDPIHVSELARRLRVSRPLLYQHLNHLGTAGLIGSGLEQLGESRMRKHYRIAPSQFEVTPDHIKHLISQG